MRYWHPPTGWICNGDTTDGQIYRYAVADGRPKHHATLGGKIFQYAASDWWSSHHATSDGRILHHAAWMDGSATLSPRMARSSTVPPPMGGSATSPPWMGKSSITPSERPNLPPRRLGWVDQPTRCCRNG
ncbi:hypothetical protein TRIUR3_14667 [Triticum urartu]|uniref:Uncharacterized protein n=1 Tax=Triticum urartu TaxID=4572 RepID=M7ZT60_TRIUA|nr:hypothetical protein TRIUR3_14667 [Triticum urartu]